MNFHYKNRVDKKSKSISVYLALEHAKLQLNNSDFEWKNFSGLQKLQTNLKAEEYFDGLLQLMTAFQIRFVHHNFAEKLIKDIASVSKLKDSRKIAKEQYEQNCVTFRKSRGASEKHFALLGIISYLERRYKYNPTFRTELVTWCKEDIDLYELFITEFHENDLLTLDELVFYSNNATEKRKKLKAIPFEKVKRVKNYFVPRLNSFDVLHSIYTQERNIEELRWLEHIGLHIGYIEELKSN